MIWDGKGNFCKFIDWEATGAHLTRALGQVVLNYPCWIV